MLASQMADRGMAPPAGFATACRSCAPGGLGARPVMVQARGGGLRGRPSGRARGLGAADPVNWEALFWDGIIDPSVQFPLDPADAAVTNSNDPSWFSTIDWGSVGAWVNGVADTISDPLQGWFAWRASMEQRAILDQRRKDAGNARPNSMAWLLPVGLVGGGAVLVFALRRK